MDDLYDLDEAMSTPGPNGAKNWFILKPGMSDKGQGIRLFSSPDELREIFEEMESDSEDEDEDEEEDEDGDEDQKSREEKKELDHEEDDEQEEHDDDEETGIASSQLRHFVIQQYLPNPLLLQPSSSSSSSPSPPSGRKFHLRAYMLLSSAYTVHLSRTTLALFSSLPYQTPTSHEESLLPHLTNTCLQPPMSPGEVDEENVHLWWELEGSQGYAGGEGGENSSCLLTKEVLEQVWQQVGKVG